MKINALTILLLLYANLIFGQIPNNAMSIEDKEFNQYFLNKENIPTVKGKIINLPKTYFYMVKLNYAIVTPFNKFHVEKSGKLNSDGTFELELDYAFPYQQIWLSVGRFYYAGIYVNKDLYIELDAEILRSNNGQKYNGAGVKYLGTDGELNTFLNNHVLYKRGEQLKLSDTRRDLIHNNKLEYKTFISKYDSLYSIINELDNEYIKRNTSQYAWIIKNERQSDYLADLCFKHWNQEMPTELFEKVKNHKAYITSNSGMTFYNHFFSYLNTWPRYRRSLDLRPYLNYSKLDESNKKIRDTILSIEKLMIQQQPYDTTYYISMYMQAYKFLQDTLLVAETNTKIKYIDSIFDISKSDFFKIKIYSNDPKEQKIITETVLSNIKTDWCKSVTTKQFKDTKEQIESINKILKESKSFVSDNQLGVAIKDIPLGAKLYTVDNIKADTLLMNIKNSFENKTIIIDFWATWCGACINEFPYSKKLHDETKDLPVEFVYVCTSSNSTIEKWKSKIADFQLGGTHLYVEHDIVIELMNLFTESGFPSYVLINSKGEYKPGVINRMSILDKDKLSELIK